MDGVLVEDKSKYKTGVMVMSLKDGLGLGLFFWGARNEYGDIRPEVPYLADEELGVQNICCCTKVPYTVGKVVKKTKPIYIWRILKKN